MSVVVGNYHTYSEETPTFNNGICEAQFSALGGSPTVSGGFVRRSGICIVLYKKETLPSLEWTPSGSAFPAVKASSRRRAGSWCCATGLAAISLLDLTANEIKPDSLVLGAKKAYEVPTF